MSSVQPNLDNGDEFPPLNATTQPTTNQTTGNNDGNKKSPDDGPVKKKFHNNDDAETDRQHTENQQNLQNQQQLRNAKTENQDLSSFSSGDVFVTCRIGSQLIDYHTFDLDQMFQNRYVNDLSDFILLPIAPVRTNFYEVDTFEAMPDLILPADRWHSRVAIDLGAPRLDYFDPRSSKYFDKLFRHAMYLSPSVIVITCPSSDIARATCASITNDRLKDSRIVPLVLFRVSLDGYKRDSEQISWNALDRSLEATNNNGLSSKATKSDEESQDSREEMQLDSEGSDEFYVRVDDHHSDEQHQSQQQQQQSQSEEKKDRSCPWNQWNAMRSHLRADDRIGVCLAIREDLFCLDEEELTRWTGEPVRMIIISTDQFVRMPRTNGSLRLSRRCKDFITKIMVANSLKTALVIESLKDCDLAEYMIYLDEMIGEILQAHPDPLRCWNDKIQPPLQPLSSNLDSSTYAVFETDSKKYLQYRDSMIEALDHLIQRETCPTNQGRMTFILMVLGAGRGPLVDAFIDAIRAINCKHKFKIYALDKNPSSIRSLKYKQKRQWTDSGTSDMFETEVIEADMRQWEPKIKADIIATELLGSLSDNELSPECIDGVWKISTPMTISIPQEYSSHIAPICSYKLHQKLYRLQGVEPNVYDQIYVSRISNCYLISKPEKMFTFEHKDLSISPDKRCNERFTKLTFWSKVDTVCHGFAGYFSAHLFGTTYISTVDGQATPNMNSWFPAFIPVEQPIQMPKDTRLELLFWRKESSTNVWYEWAITHPVQSRIYSQSGVKSAMSKFIE